MGTIYRRVVVVEVVAVVVGVVAADVVVELFYDVVVIAVEVTAAFT